MVSPDHKAQLEQFHEESFSWALTCCRGNQADAEDVLQTVYLQVLEGKARFGEQSEFKTWLFSVIRNQAAKEMRRQIARRLLLLRRDREPQTQPAPMSPDHTLETIESRSAFECALNQLSGRQREILHLVFFEEMTIEAASSIMGISVGSARQHYERGKASLRKVIAELNNRETI